MNRTLPQFYEKIINFWTCFYLGYMKKLYFSHSCITFWPLLYQTFIHHSSRDKIIMLNLIFYAPQSEHPHFRRIIIVCRKLNKRAFAIFALSCTHRKIINHIACSSTRIIAHLLQKIFIWKAFSCEFLFQICFLFPGYHTGSVTGVDALSLCIIRHYSAHTQQKLECAL